MMPIATPRIMLAANGVSPSTTHHGHHAHHTHHGHPHTAINAQYAMTPPHGTNDQNSTHSALEIAQQPPDSWYKDQFGRKATFDFSVRRVSRGCAGCTDQRHLNVHLLYESGKLVENQNILRVASGLCLNKDDTSVLAIRIMEVSKNHQNQRFRVQISLPPCPLKALGAGVTCVISEPVLVLSKKNKRPVKPDADDAQSNGALKLKKSKLLMMSPNGSAQGANSPCGSTYNTPTSRGRGGSAPPEFDGLAETMPEDDQWGSEIVRFRSPTPSLCLWANAAFNFMHKLQWQDRAEPSPNDGLGDGAMFRCPACHATYGAKPIHRIECDLALLLDQTESLDDTHENENTEKLNKLSPQASHQDDFNREYFASQKPPTRPSIGQEPSFGKAKSASGPPLSIFNNNNVSVDLLAKNLNLSSWEGYSSLSKIMFSLEADIKHTKETDPFIKVGDRENKTSDVSMNSSLASGGSLWSFATAAPPPPGQFSLNLSSLLSSVKGLSPDTAAFLQEQDAELTGDASLLRSLSKVSLTDFLGGDGASSSSHFSTNVDGDAIPSAGAMTSLSTVMMDESKSHITENSVVTIASVDFRHCGHPAFDASYALMGFYFLSESKSQAELRFLPNFYPLPAQMLQDLDKHLVEWKQQPNVLLHMRSDSSAASLAKLKTQVIQALRSHV